MIGAIEKNKAVKLNKDEAGVLYFYTGWSGNRLGGIWATKGNKHVMVISRRKEFQVGMNAFGWRGMYTLKNNNKKHTHHVQMCL